MYDNAIFRKGICGVLRADWTLRCETPLVVRNGVSVSYVERKPDKSRGVGVRVNWRVKSEEDPPAGFKKESQVAALAYGYEIAGGKVSPYYQVPGSSVRGALRGWTVSHLVERDYRGKLTPPKNGAPEQETYLPTIRAAAEDPASGYALLAALFGFALDTRDEEVELANAGRLQVEADKFTTPPVPVTINGLLEQGSAGPHNARRQMTVRNPLDRVTHASRDGGLHQFLEFCRGESFKVHLSILNPQETDLALLALWVREMQAGLLRIGALANIGRGRVSVQDPTYTHWSRYDLRPLADFVPAPEAEQANNSDALAGLWKGYKLPPDRLKNFIRHLETNTGGAHAR